MVLIHRAILIFEREDSTVHVLTKIFIVLVSILAVFLVPLVVVYSYNEDNYKGKFQTAELQAAIASDALQAAESRHAAVVGRLQIQLSELERDKADLDRELTNAQVELRAVESKLISAESMKIDIFGRLTILASATEASQLIVNDLLAEVRDLRNNGVRIREQNTELDEALRDMTGQLQVNVAARRALEEELQRLRDEYNEAIAKVADFTAIYGTIQPVAVSTFGGIAPDRDLDAPIISVSRSPQGTYAEIDAGSRDGVKVGWIMTIHHGGKFIGNLRIEKVDLNKSTGIVMLEDESRAGLVQVGHGVIARAGRN